MRKCLLAQTSTMPKWSRLIAGNKLEKTGKNFILLFDAVPLWHDITQGGQNSYLSSRKTVVGPERLFGPAL